MKILLIANEMKSVDRITNYSDMWSFYLSLALRKCNVHVIYFSPKVDDVDLYIKNISNYSITNGVDHILALGVNYFTNIPCEVGEKLSSRFKGLVCQIHDGSLLDGVPVDINFTVRQDEWRYKDNDNNRLIRHLRYNYYIGWAAEREMFFPEQKKNILQVFVDHSSFVETEIDYSLNIYMSLKKLKKDVNLGKILGFNSMIIKTLTDKGIEEVENLESIIIKPYNRKTVPLPIFSSELRKSHLFIVTHKESVGLSVLEAAHCGAFVLAPKNTINPDRLECVKHMIFQDSIDWAKVSDNLKPEINSLFVQSQNWESVACNILNGLSAMKKRDEDK